MRKLVDGKKVAEYAFVETAFAPIDVYKERKKSGILTEASTKEVILSHPSVKDPNGDQVHIPLDMATWLPFAAAPLHISPRMEDYVMVPVIVMPTDLPNRNGVAFPLKELIAWDTEIGRQAYKTWKGMPTYSEHQNDNLELARGVIADSVMRKLVGYGSGAIWKVLLLLTFDRSKYPDVAQRILSGETNSYSMGAWVNDYECSFCHSQLGKCNHVNPKAPAQINSIPVGGSTHLAFRNAKGIKGFECSEVGTPAYISAISDTVKPWSLG